MGVMPYLMTCFMSIGELKELNLPSTLPCKEHSDPAQPDAAEKVESSISPNFSPKAQTESSSSRDNSDPTSWERNKGTGCLFCLFFLAIQKFFVCLEHFIFSLPRP